MKKLLITLLLTTATISSLSAQNTMTLVMKYYWDLSNKDFTTMTEGKCKDGFEFDFATGKAKYYTPDGEITTTLCRIVSAPKAVVNEDGSTTRDIKLYMIGSETTVECILNASEDLKKIRFTMKKGDIIRVYNVSNMMTETEN